MYNWEAFEECMEDVRKSYWAEAYEWLAQYEKENIQE